MKTFDCSRCWFARRMPSAGVPGADLRFTCAHPERAASHVRPRRAVGPTGLVQLTVCPRAK